MRSVDLRRMSDTLVCIPREYKHVDSTLCLDSFPVPNQKFPSWQKSKASRGSKTSPASMGLLVSQHVNNLSFPAKQYKRDSVLRRWMSEV